MYEGLSHHYRCFAIIISMKNLGVGNSVVYGVLLDIIWIICDKIRCYAKEVLPLNVPPDYVNLYGLSTTRCTSHYTLKTCSVAMEVISNEEVEDI